jgi:hypothetical protein
MPHFEKVTQINARHPKAIGRLAAVPKAEFDYVLFPFGIKGFMGGVSPRTTTIYHHIR